jgi:hypothetical protein
MRTGGFFCNFASALKMTSTWHTEYSTRVFDICGSVHHHLINKTSNVMQLGAIVLIIPWTALYTFRALFTPIIRSVLKLYMQLLVQSYVGMVSDPVCYKMIRSRERTALVCRYGVRSGLLQDDQKSGAYSTPNF